MSTAIIVSYDGTPNDDDGLALGRLLAAAGASIGLAYVRHSVEFDPAREAMAQHDAERRLDTGITWLGMPDAGRHIVVSPSTGTGLAELARTAGIDVMVFGSDYRTTPGRPEPGPTARFLIESGPVAVAIAPAGLRARPGGEAGTVATFDDGDPSVAATAQSLAAALGVETAERPSAAGVGLLVLGSRPGAPDGQVSLSSAGRAALEEARSAVLVLPRGTALTFG